MRMDTRFKVVRQSAPITFVDVEKSFSICKNILSPNCQHFTEDSLFK